MRTIDNSIKNLLSNILDVSGEERKSAITAMIQDRHDEIRYLTKEIFWLKQLRGRKEQDNTK